MSETVPPEMPRQAAQNTEITIKQAVFACPRRLDHQGCLTLFEPVLGGGFRELLRPSRRSAAPRRSPCAGAKRRFVYYIFGPNTTSSTGGICLLADLQ